MKRKIALILSALSLFLTACSPSISFTAKGSKGADVVFSASLSKQLESTFRELTGAMGGASTEEFFTAGDIAAFLTACGVENVKASAKKNSSISANGTISSVFNEPFFSSKILNRTENSMSLTLGPEQLSAVYASLGEEAQSYFDLLMCPVLTGEKMSVKEYENLLASVYGPDLAKEVVNGKMNIELKDKDSKKSVKAFITAGELLTMNSEKTWTVSW